MPRIKRWFPVSHDINHSPTVRQLVREHGAAGLRIWLEILSIADRSGGFLDCTSEGALSRLSSAAESRMKVVSSVVHQLMKVGSLSLHDAINHVTEVVNYSEYHRSEERIKFPPDPTRPTRPDPTSLKKGSKIVYPPDFQASQEIIALALEKDWPNPKTELEAFKDYHQARGSRFTDWDAALRTWLRNAKKWESDNRKGNNQANPDRPSPPYYVASKGEKKADPKIREGLKTLVNDLTAKMAVKGG